MANVVDDDGLQFEGEHHGVFQDPLPPNGNLPTDGGHAVRAAATNDARAAALNARHVPARQTLRDHDAPNIDFFRDRNQHLPINRNDFEIKTGLLALVKQNQFFVHSSENHVYHLDNFEDICRITRMNGVPDDIIKCRLFIFSLADNAHRWLKSLDPINLRSWEDYKAAFLGQYFTQSRTAILRNKISSFQQGGTESFPEAWERFKDYYRECPHHGFSRATLISTFYQGVDKAYKMALDTASNGDFMTKTETEATKLIKNLAASNINHNVDYDRSNRGGGGELKQLAELSVKVEQLLRRDQKVINFCEDSSKGMVHQEYSGDCSEDLQAEMNFVNGYGNYQNRGFNQN